MNRIVSPEINPHIYIQWTFNKGTKNTQWKNSLFNQWCWENSITTCKSMKLDPHLTPLTNVNTKCIKDLNKDSERERNSYKIRSGAVMQPGLTISRPTAD